ncbi:MAG: MaoC family dehydratase [Rhodoferax sp.]
MAIETHGTYFEDFSVNEVYEHARGRTVTNQDNYTVSHMSMNTAHAHFDIEYSRQALDGLFSERIVAGPCTLGLVVGLTCQDMSENAFMDIGMTGLRLPNPVFAGDTLRAKSEVLTLDDDRVDSGVMRYRFTATNQHGRIVAEGERTVRLKKRSAWGARDCAVMPHLKSETQFTGVKE